MKKRDLRAELLIAEQEARDKKRKAEGKPPLGPPSADRLSITGQGEEEEANKRRKLLQDVELDKDDDNDDSQGPTKDGNNVDADDRCVLALLVLSF